MMTAERFENIAVEACRTNVRPVFEAIACHNPHAVRHFTDHHFAHLVLKALFTWVPLATSLQATGDSALGRGTRGAIPLVLHWQAADLSLPAGASLTWTLRLRAPGE